MAEKIFVDGLIVKITEKRPAWALCKLSIKVDDLIKFLQENASEKGWVNIDLNIGKSGKPYAQLDTWQPNQNKAEQEEASQAELNNIDLNEAFPDEEEIL